MIMIMIRSSQSLLSLLSHDQNRMGALLSIFSRRNHSTSKILNESESGNEEVPRGDHLTRTSQQSRDPDFHKVTVIEITNISPTVKRLVLQTLQDTKLPVTFKAGQWVDLFIPELDKVGGFSMTSSPTYLRKTGKLEFAVKYSTWPTTHWIHTKCQVGYALSVRVGGDFFFDLEDHQNFGKRVLLIAGGVGINPLTSIALEIHDSRKDKGHGLRTTLLFSAKGEDELLFHEKFQVMALNDDQFNYQMFVTGGSQTSKNDMNPIKSGRISLEDVRQALDSKFCLKEAEYSEKLIVFVCGPPPMIQEMTTILHSLGVSNQNIKYEKWW